MVWRFLARLFLFHHLLLLLLILLLQSSRNTVAGTAPLLAFPTFFIHWDFLLLRFCSFPSSIHELWICNKFLRFSACVLFLLCQCICQKNSSPSSSSSWVICFRSQVVLWALKNLGFIFFFRVFPSWAEGGGGWISGSCFHVQCFGAADSCGKWGFRSNSKQWMVQSLQHRAYRRERLASKGNSAAGKEEDRGSNWGD